MAEASEIPSLGRLLATETPPEGQPVPQTQSQPVADSKLAGILEKQGRGEKLSRAEAGYLGGVRRKEKPAVAQSPASNQNPLLEIAANPDNPLFEPAAKAEAPAVRAVVAVVDSALIRRTADALLSSLDTGTKIYVGYEAKQAGGDKATVEEYKSAVALQPDNRQLMVENSEPVVLGLCNFFGCTPDKLEGYIKNSGFLAGAIAHGIGVVAAVKSIRESKKERAQQPEKPA